MTVHTHGTIRGYTRGCRCERCTAAWRDRYRARGRAVQRLINAHPEEFSIYFADEKARMTPTPTRPVSAAVGEVVG